MKLVLMVPWAAVFFFLAMFFFCLGMISNHERLNANIPFAMHAVGVFFLAVAAVCLLAQAFQTGTP